MSGKKIILTGGGTAGHVTANIALLPGLRERGYEISYIGSYDGIEKALITAENVPYYGIATGKFRRYLSLRNLTDPFRVIKGYFEARALIRKLKPDVLFSKGGFVAVPVVFAAKHAGIPVVSHESDMTPGLANRLTLPCVRRVCCNFPETAESLPAGKAAYTGSPIRASLLSGDPEEGRRITGFPKDRPVLMIIGGSLGAVAVNDMVRKVLPELLREFYIVHICGQKNLDSSLEGTPGYRQFGYVSQELPHLYALADLVISRAGANVICELLALRKPNILIPLPLSASRGDQILNAQSFEKQGFSRLLRQEDMTEESLLTAVRETWQDRERYIASMQAADAAGGVEAVLRIIESCTEKDKEEKKV